MAVCGLFLAVGVWPSGLFSVVEGVTVWVVSAGLGLMVVGLLVRPGGRGFGWLRVTVWVVAMVVRMVFVCED